MSDATSKKECAFQKIRKLREVCNINKERKGFHPIKGNIKEEGQHLEHPKQNKIFFTAKAYLRFVSVHCLCLGQIKSSI